MTSSAEIEQQLPSTIAGYVRSVRFNGAESPLGWLHSRGLVTLRQFDAGERLLPILAGLHPGCQVEQGVKFVA